MNISSEHIPRKNGTIAASLSVDTLIPHIVISVEF
jgi:hypothetical protein